MSSWNFMLSWIQHEKLHNLGTRSWYSIYNSKRTQCVLIKSKYSYEVKFISYTLNLSTKFWELFIPPFINYSSNQPHPGIGVANFSEIIHVYIPNIYKNFKFIPLTIKREIASNANKSRSQRRFTEIYERTIIPLQVLTLSRDFMCITSLWSYSKVTWNSVTKSLPFYRFSISKQKTCDFLPRKKMDGQSKLPQRGSAFKFFFNCELTQCLSTSDVQIYSPCEGSWKEWQNGSDNREILNHLFFSG